MNYFVNTCTQEHFDKAIYGAEKLLYLRSAMLAMILAFADTQNKLNPLLQEKIDFLFQHKKYFSHLTQKQKFFCFGLTHFPNLTIFLARQPLIAQFFNKRYHFDQYDLSR